MKKRKKKKKANSGWLRLEMQGVAEQHPAEHDHVCKPLRVTSHAPTAPGTPPLTHPLSAIHSQYSRNHHRHRHHH